MNATWPKRLAPAAVVVACLGALAGCNDPTPLRPVNRSPIVYSLMAFPTTIAPGDSAIVVCIAMDPDGDTLVYDWNSDCRMVMKGQSPYRPGVFNQYDNTMVVYPSACNRAPLDTGWVSCEVRDRRGGGADAGFVRIIVRQ